LIAYETPPGSIVVDGILDDEAWQEVSWIDGFVDIRGYDYPTQPWFDARVKVRFDSTFIYFGVHFQETQVWAFMTEHDSFVYLDNCFEVFFDPSGGNHWYKEYQINAINVDWDLEMSKPYLDNGTADSSWETLPLKKSAIYVDGPGINPFLFLFLFSF